MDASDFSFFDDDSQVADKFSSNFSEKESNSRKKSDSDHWDLHGTNNITNQVMKSSDVSDSDDSVDEVVQSPTTTATSSSCQKEDYHSPVILSSTDEDDDTLTDVSPQSSPESSPRMKRSFRYSFSEDEKDHGDSKISKNNSETKSENEQVKHITKLNVTFKQANTSDINLEKVPHRKSKPQKTKSHKSRTDGRFSIDHVEGTLNRYFKKDSSKQVTEHVSNSSHEKEAIKKEENKDIDLNHLLEIILDLEEKGINVKEKYKEQSSQRRANHNRRNMSFSNNQVCINLIITSTNQIICFSFVRLRWKISVCSKSSAKRLRDLDHLVLQVLQLPDLDFQLKAVPALEYLQHQAVEEVEIKVQLQNYTTVLLIEQIYSVKLNAKICKY